VNDPVDSVLAQREALDRGFSNSLLMSGAVHAVVLGSALLAAWLAPREPLLNLAMGFVEPLPGGGRGNPNPAPQAPAPAPVKSAAPEPEAPAPPVTAPPIIKPPKEEPRKGLPPLEAKPTKAKPVPTPGRPSATTSVATGRPAPSGGGGQGTAQSPFGLEFGKEGPGIPGGGDTGDYYLAGVQRKVWTIWMQQVKNDFTQPVSVAFTILADGSVTNVQVTRPSGVFLLDSAARRAVETAAPFNRLPRDYGTDQITVQANFKPTP
jgi:periplasmic protein TonB